MIDISKISGFEWDTGNMKKNWVKHGVSNEECEEAFFDSCHFNNVYFAEIGWTEIPLRFNENEFNEIPFSIFNPLFVIAHFDETEFSLIYFV